MSATAQLVARLYSTGVLHDSLLSRFEVWREGDELSARLRFAPAEKHGRKSVVLQFEGVQVFDVCWRAPGDFWRVESLQLFAIEPGVYLSLDPYAYTSARPDERDRQVVVAARLKLEAWE